MANNENINKVVYSNETLIDLTEDSVTPQTLLEGETAHDRSGAQVTGVAKQGHIIWNAIKTALTQRTKLWFADAKATDDTTEQATKIEVVQVIDDESDLDDAPDGIYQGDYEDEPEYILDASMVAYDNGSVEDALDAINADIIDRTFHIKTVQIAGVTISNYYGQVSTGLDTTKYKVIGFFEGDNWDQKINFTILNDGSKINIKCIESSYTIPNNRNDLSLIYVSKNAFT